MPAIEKKARKPSSRSAKAKTERSSRSKTSPPLSRKPRNHPRPLFQKKEHKTAEGPTFLYECARPGCGYRIWREDKDEEGHLRFDLKCPKCHHQVFRCLGKEDVPEKFGTPVEPNKDIEQQTLDFGALSTHDLSE